MSLPANARREVVLAGLTGALALVSPAAIPPRALLGYRLACAGLSGAYTYDVLRRDEGLADQPVVPLALAAGATGAMFGTMGLWERCDSAVHRWLVARGVRHPRLVLAAGTAATSLVSGLLDARSRPGDDEEDEAGPSLVDLDPRLRTLVAAILAATDDFSAPVLRQQLDLVQAEVWDPDSDLGEGPGQDPDEELPAFVGLAVAGAHDVARAVPHSFVFPVHAEFEHAGTTFELAVEVQDGRLSSVSLAPADPSADLEDTAGGWPTSWPAAVGVSLRHESSTG